MSAAIAAAAAAAANHRRYYNNNINSNNYSVIPTFLIDSPNYSLVRPSHNRYASQKRRDWNTFTQYLRDHRPRLPLNRCSGEHVLEFLRYLDQFGNTKVHNSENCPLFGQSHTSSNCACPVRQGWGSVDAIVGRLRAAFEENGGSPDLNPFAGKTVRVYLSEVRETQAKAKGVMYEKNREAKSGRR